jgi:fucose 4-O-acetylase-like acetyltransferase
MLRAVATIAAIAGGMVSFVLMLRSGHPPLFLIVLFTVWVLFPFAALIVAAARSTRWPVRTRTTLHLTTLVIAVASPALYAYAVLGSPATRPTPWFVLVPPVSCAVAIVVVAIAAFMASGSRLR